MKVLKLLGLITISLLLIGIIVIFEIEMLPVGSSIAGLILGFSLPATLHALQDVFDTTNWKTSQRKLKRGGFINDETIVRTSFAYLYRIKVGNYYFLVKNERGTGKYQPVGGVYTLTENEKIVLKNKYQVKDDNKILIDESSRDDYRLRIENKYLRRFVRRFDRKADRERIDNIGREFKEELVEKGIVSWSTIRYRYCGRHMTELKYGEHFQIYELLLADVVELMPTADQEKDLQQLMKTQSDLYRFATAEEIVSLGVNTSTGELKEIIGDHSQKIIQENEGQLIKDSNTGKIYTININTKC